MRRARGRSCSTWSTTRLREADAPIFIGSSWDASLRLWASAAPHETPAHSTAPAGTDGAGHTTAAAATRASRCVGTIGGVVGPRKAVQMKQPAPSMPFRWPAAARRLGRCGGAVAPAASRPHGALIAAAHAGKSLTLAPLRRWRLAGSHPVGVTRASRRRWRAKAWSSRCRARTCTRSSGWRLARRRASCCCPWSPAWGRSCSWWARARPAAEAPPSAGLQRAPGKGH